jgi:hypothetical protein
MLTRDRQKRDGKVIAFFVLLLPALLGIVSLTIDAGIMLAMHRHAQSAADGAALAAARDLLANSSGTMSATALSIVSSCSNLGTAQVQVNCPPTLGSFAGNSQYVEVIVTVPVDTYFIQVLSNQSTQVVNARAVAGVESVAPHELITCLAPYAAPGLTINGITLSVAGPIAVNSQGSGVDQNNASINYGLASPAVTLPNGGTVCSTNLRVVGGVANPSSITTSSSTSPALSAGLLPRSDPFLNLPTPSTATGVVTTSFGNVAQTLGGDNITLTPGIYTSLVITGPGPGTLTFQPGVYVFQGGDGSGNALTINTAGTIVANGVLFYNTGSSYDPGTGLPDQNDGNALGTEAGTLFGRVQIQAGNLTVSGLGSAGSPLNGMVFYQRRWNTQPVSIYSGTSTSQITGTIYARWAQASFTMSGNWQGQIAAGSVSMNGLTANNPVSMCKGTVYAISPQVFLVE